MSSTKLRVSTITIDASQFLLRLVREIMWGQSNNKRIPDPVKRREKFYELGNKLEFTMRILPELNACVDVEWGLINGALETVERELAELRDDPGEGWKFPDED